MISQTAPRKHRLLCVGHRPDRAFYTRRSASILRAWRALSPFWLSGELDQGLQIVFFQMEGQSAATRRPLFSTSSRAASTTLWPVLVAKGVTIVTPVSEAPGGWSADFLDPDGFGLGLYQSGEKPRSLKQ